MEHKVSVEPQIGEVPKLREDVLAGLVRFGFAPGNYAGKCHTCGDEVWNIDKRATNCVDCAMKLALEAATLGFELATMSQGLPKDAVEAQVFATKGEVFARAYAAARPQHMHSEAMANAVEAVQRFTEVATGKPEPKRR